MIPILLEHNADPTIRDNDGYSAIELTSEKKTTSNIAITVLLLRHYQSNGIVPPRAVRRRLDLYFKEKETSISMSSKGPHSKMGIPESFEEKRKKPTTFYDNVHDDMANGRSSSDAPLHPSHSLRASSDLPQSISKMGHSHSNSRLSPQKSASPRRQNTDSPTKVFAIRRVDDYLTSNIQQQQQHNNNARSRSPVSATAEVRSGLNNLTFSSSSSKKNILVQNNNAEDTGGLMYQDGNASAAAAATNDSAEEEWPCDHVPFLPITSKSSPHLSKSQSTSAFLDVIIQVEHCTDCHLHSEHTHHEAKRYVRAANDSILAIIKAMADAQLAVRLFALRSVPLGKDRLGALEISIAINSTPPLASEQESASQLLAWKTFMLHSKLASKRYASHDISNTH